MAFVNIEQIKVIIFRRLIFFVKFSSFEGKGKNEVIFLDKVGDGLVNILMYEACLGVQGHDDFEFIHFFFLFFDF